MLVELGVVEQRYDAVKEVLVNGATAIDVATRYGVSRQTVQNWLRRYRAGGLAALADRTKRPTSCPHQMTRAVEERLCELRHAHPSWGPDRLGHELRRAGLEAVPGRTSIYRALVRNGLIEPAQRRRQRADYRRWERSRPMELWQLDVMGFRLADGTRVSLITGLDDHSRFCVLARAVARATAPAVCDAFAEALGRHGCPDDVLTDNGKVFTGRFNRGRLASEVLFERICRDNGIRALLTAPYSPTTTGKVERFHRTLRAELFATARFVDLEQAQAGVDSYVEHYNAERPHQALGMATPAQRFRFDEAVRALPAPVIGPLGVEESLAGPDPARRGKKPAGPGLRKVGAVGTVRYDLHRYYVGRNLAGKYVTVVPTDQEIAIVYLGVEVRRYPRQGETGNYSGPRRRPSEERHVG